jgi:predicted ATPase
VKEDGKLNVAAPRGVYVHGSVGSGKTLLMDFFYKTATLSKKQRIHFHQFMLDVHKRTYADLNRQIVAGRYSHKVVIEYLFCLYGQLNCSCLLLCA